MCNAKFAEKGLPCRIDHRSYVRQGLEQLPTVHEGPAVRQMEARGIATDKGELNRWIRATNALLKEAAAEGQGPVRLAQRGAGGAFQAPGPHPCRPVIRLLRGAERGCVEQ